MEFKKEILPHYFVKWIEKDKENKLLFSYSFLLIIISFAWLKIVYPYPNFMPPDSYSYLEAANSNQFINIWPIGYSKFLRLISSFSNSHLVLVLFQYLFLQFSLLYLLFTIRHVFLMNKWFWRIIFTISLCNPLLPHISNYVSSDCLFTSLSIIWFTQLLRFFLKPTRALLLTHSLILLLSFTVRYSALYYPIVSLLVITFSSFELKIKLFGLSLIISPLIFFIGCTYYEYFKKTSTIQYSAFGGWQMAANALYGYAHSELIKTDLVPKKFKELHKVVNYHMDSVKNLKLRPDNNIGIYYLWDFKSPLRIYTEKIWQKDTVTSYFIKWASMAPLYAAYGRYLTKKYPIHFLKYFAWPNLKRYYAPPSYFMGMYNLGNTTVEPIAVSWFGWKSNSLSSHASNKKILIADIFTILTPIINVIFITSFLGFLNLREFKTCNKVIRQIIALTISIWLANTFFSVLTAPIELRYQLFPLVINLIWSSIFLFFIISSVKGTTK